MSSEKQSEAPCSDQSKQIALVDCNNFYVSCERVFNPAWDHLPVGVLSNNDGCIVARSNELKALGIPTGAPYFKYKAQLKAMGAIIVSSNYGLYGDMSARVMTTLSQFSPDVEIYSIDEAWLNLSSLASETIDDYARHIAATVYQHTGIPVSIGLGPTKVLAKIANRLCKQRSSPDRVLSLSHQSCFDERLAGVPVEEIWGVGRRWAQRLRAQGIQTALDLKQADRRNMRDRYNVFMERLILELRGISCLQFEDIQPKKQIIASRSFGQRVTDLSALLQAVSSHTARAAEKLRAQSSICGVVQCSIHTSRHHPWEPFFRKSALVTLKSPTSDTRKLITAACQGVRSIYKCGPRYAKAGVILLDLSPANEQQLNLLHQPDSQQSDQLMTTVDALNRRYGRNSVFFGRSGIQTAWAMRRDHVTPSYTTRWGDVPKVH